MPYRCYRPYRGCRSAALAFVLILMQTTATASDVLPQLIPAPQLGASEVVRIQLSTLANNDSPRPDAGIEITFRFASPENRKLTGPLPRFIELVINPVYGPMINHREVEYGKPVAREGRIMVPVMLTAVNGVKAAYIFVVGKQTGECEGCWMTEAVFRIPIDQMDPDSDAAPKLGV